jgi:hypothetical protein
MSIRAGRQRLKVLLHLSRIGKSSRGPSVRRSSGIPLTAGLEQMPPFLPDHNIQKSVFILE